MNRKDAELLAKEAFTYSGYHIKTVQWRSNRIDTRFWSLGEEWERNYAKLQALPTRHCIVKHKIKGGMLPLETVSIKPAYQVLSMNPEAYAAYLESLPFGKTYLRERAAVTMHHAQERKPQLEEEHQAFVSYVIASPDAPVSSVYKGLGVGVWKGNQLRDELKEQDLIAELEVRTGRTSAGRPTKVVISSFTALELLGKEPPVSRGGVIHRHIQHLVEEGAAAKRFTAQCEYDVGNGGIVDVHLEHGEVKIAVEIATMSKPQREIAHIKHCLEAGYDKVFTVFVDQRLLERMQEAMQGQFSDEERARVQLLPLSKLSGIVAGK